MVNVIIALTSRRRNNVNPRIEKFIQNLASQISTDDLATCFNNPVFIVSAPRSGSTLLFSLMSESPTIWTIGGESHGVYAQFPHLAGENATLESGRLNASHADAATRESMRYFYLALTKDKNDRPLFNELLQGRLQSVVFLEKTPRNSLNIEFLLEVFPDARFIYLHRDPRENISSLMEGWELGGKTGQFVTFRNLPDWPLGYWCFLLPPNWQKLADRPLAEIAAFQWQACNDIILHDLSAIAPDRWTSLSYKDLVESPVEQLQRLCEFCGADMGDYLQGLRSGNLPLSATTITPPARDKWKRHEVEIMAAMPSLADTLGKIESLTREKTMLS